MNTQQALQELAQGFSTAAIGKDFFHSLAQYLAKALGVDYVFIGELVQQNELVRSVVFLVRGKIEKNIEYPLVGSLCERVVRPEFCAYTSNVQQQFPHNLALKRFGVDSYIGTPLFDSAGKVLGLIYVMHSGPITDVSSSEALLRIVSRRAELELERAQQERHLQQANQGLIAQLTERQKAEEALQTKNQALEQVNEELARTQRALREANERLEQRVEARTHELSVREEELRQSMKRMVELNTALSQREAFLSSFVNQTSVGIAQTDLTGRFTFANESYCKMLGRSMPELLTETISDVTHPEDMSQNLPLLDQLIQNGKSFEIEKRYIRPDGSIVWVLNNVSLIRSADGQPINIMAVSQDITQKKEAEKALAHSEWQLRLVTDSLPVLISYIDAEERYRFVNQTYEDWFGDSRSALVGKHLREMLGEQAYQLIQPKVKQVLAGEELYFEAEINYRKAGKRSVDVRYIPHIVGGKVMGFYALVADISERKHIQKELERAVNETRTANQQLMNINADLDNFVYMASHDLRAPIANIDGLMRILTRKMDRQGWHDESTQGIIQMINSSIDRFKRTIAGMTEIAKVQKQITEEQEPISLLHIIQDIQLDLQEQIVQSQAHIEVAIDHCPDIVFSQKNLKSIFYNLLSNAIKYRAFDRPPYIVLTCQEKEEYLVFSVQDNGLGVSISDTDQIFGMFKRMHDHVEGSGIGLYMVKKMVENGGGKIEVDSRVGVGSTFRIYFRKK